MATSGKLMIGVAKRPPCAPSDVMVKVDPCEVLELRLAGARVGGEALDVARDVEDALAVGVLHDGDDEPRVGRGRDADVEVLAEDDLVGRLVERGVEHRVLLQRRDARPSR